jgi:Zinc carboxypeptidase
MASISEQPPRRSTFLSSGARSIAGFQALFLNRNAIVASLKIFGLSVGMAVAISTASAQPATYHDVEAMDAAVLRFDGVAGGRMQVRDIGTTANGRPVRAVHIAAKPNLYGTEAEASMANKPALLIECGMHAREWASPELCLKYLQVFALGFLVDPARINDILANADIYVIPMVNPDGRAFDDTEGGDPNKYWTSTALDPSDRGGGWRPNRQMTCAKAPIPTVGINIARNFSTGWSDAQSSCKANDFRGDAPFQAREAQILRRFVDNRMISMSLSVHSNGQSMGIRTGALKAIRDNVINLWNAEVPSLPLTTGATGGGLGQFPAWMADPSDTPLEPDMGTRRGAVALLRELPPKEDEEEKIDYYARPYQYSPTDSSNGFHPSAQVFLDESLQGFVASVQHLAEQTRRPWCPLTPGTLTPSAACKRDVGFTGAKIAVCTDCVGTLAESPFGWGSRQTSTAGSRQIVYRVQNFDSTTAATVGVLVDVLSRPIDAGVYSAYLFNATSFPLAPLAPGAAATASVPITFVSGREYLVQLIVKGTSYSNETNLQNNSRQFRFVVP